MNSSLELDSSLVFENAKRTKLRSPGAATLALAGAPISIGNLCCDTISGKKPWIGKPLFGYATDQTEQDQPLLQIQPITIKQSKQEQTEQPVPTDLKRQGSAGKII